MLFDNYLTFVYIALFVIIYRIVKYITQRSFIRNIALALGNLFMLLTLVKEHTIIVIAIICALIYVTGVLLQKKRIKYVFVFMLALIIALFSIHNYTFVQNMLSYTFLAIVNKPILSVQKLGLSYILFRFIHWLNESYRGNIHKPDFFSFLNYIFFFPTILAGPIDNYNNFNYWLMQPRLNYDRELFFAGVSRIFMGAVKTMGIVPLVDTYALNYHSLMPTYSPIEALCLSLLAYSAYIYFDFSGYSDIAIGTAYLVGIRTPENFNNPYISKNLSEFWKRWHITFSSFLMLYVFKPLTKQFHKIIPHRHKLPVTIICYMLTFFACGLWHGSGLNFIYWGLWHGIGLTMNKIWRAKLKPSLLFFNSRFYDVLSTVLTFSYVSFGWIFFCYPTAQLQAIFIQLK